MTDWQPALPPAELAERRLIQAILDGSFPIDSTLPAERELAAQLGITRPTLREVLQRMARDGWLEIRHGKATRVRNYWQEGTISILGTIAQHPGRVPADFVSKLLQVRQLMAPAYTCDAARNARDEVMALIEGLLDLPDTPEAYAQGDWLLHHRLTILSGNPVFTLILNGFDRLYHDMALRYFAESIMRRHSQRFYQHLLQAVQARDCAAVENLTRQVMLESSQAWQVVPSELNQKPISQGD